MSSDIARVNLTGNLTEDPTLKETAGGTQILKCRVAYNTPRRQPDGEWTDKANYINVDVIGNRATGLAKFMAKGMAVTVDGQLDFSEWESDGNKRHDYSVIVGVKGDLKVHGSNGNGGGTAAGPPKGAEAEPEKELDF